MPPPPIIATSAGQRLAVAALMALLLAGSLGGAYAYTRTTRQRAQPTLEALGRYSIELPGGWRALPPGSLASRIDGAREFGDPRRPTRRLIVWTHAFDQPLTPLDVVNGLVNQLIVGPIEPLAPVTSSAPPPRAELCVRGVEQGRLVQHLLAAVAATDDAHVYMAFYMREAVADQGAFQQNQFTFRNIHESLVILEP